MAARRRVIAGYYLRPLSEAAASEQEPRLPQRPPRWFPRAVLTATLIVLGVLLAVTLLSRLRSLLILLVVSFFISCAMEPGVNRLAARGWKRSRAAGLIFLIVGVVIGLFVWLMGKLLQRAGVAY